MNQEYEDIKVVEEASNKVNALLEGKMPEAMDVTSYSSNSEKQLAESINVLIKSYLALEDVVPSPNWEFDKNVPDGKELPSGLFENVQFGLLHSIMQSQRKNDGDYNKDSYVTSDTSGNLVSMNDEMAAREVSPNKAIGSFVESKRTLLRECIEFVYGPKVENE